MSVTLTDIMPTLRMSIPDPIDLDRWPPGTSVTLDDVVVQGLSMTAASGLLRTPMQWAHDDRSTPALLICTVSAVITDDQGSILLVDCDVRSPDTIAWDHARLIGRVSVAHRRPVRLLADGSQPPAVVTATGTGDCPDVTAPLPRDLVVGDRIAVPYRVTADATQTPAEPRETVVVGRARAV